jgi:hypothetical protein
VLDVLADAGHSEFAVDRVRSAIEADRQIAGRLALWARRLVGEALSQAQRVAVERDALATLVAGGSGPVAGATGMDLAEMSRVFARLTESHAQRMARLGLTT